MNGRRMGLGVKRFKQPKTLSLRFSRAVLSGITLFILVPVAFSADHSSAIGEVRSAKAVKPLSAASAPATKVSDPKPRIEKKERHRHSRLKVTRVRLRRSTVTPMPPLSEAPFTAAVPLLPVIEKAKSLLEHERVSYFPGSRNQPARREVKLVLANFRNGNIRIIPGREEGQKFKLLDPGVRYEMNWWNGYNSSINILEPADTGVVALLYALDSKHQKSLRQDAIIYTPYSSALLQRELIEAGKDYLMGKILQARRELSHVDSQAVPGKSLSDQIVFSNEDYFNLILTEQMDPGRFRSIVVNGTEFNSQQESQLIRLAERILVIIGANQEDAYRFTGSYARARGLAQFTPTGMRAVWDLYPGAGIPYDFRGASSGHVSAIKAEICLLDSYLAELSRSHPILLESGFEKYAAVACYNGGAKRVRRALGNFGVDWLYPKIRLTNLSVRKDLTQKERAELLWLSRNRSHETHIYLNKLHAIEHFKEKLLLTGTIDSSASVVPEIPSSKNVNQNAIVQ